MSIVNQTSGPTFNYATHVTGWVCATVYQNLQPMNNTSPEGWIFYSAVGAGNTTPLSLYAVQTCDGPEGVYGADAVAPALPTVCDPSTNQFCGREAIKNDMIDPSRSQTGVCQHY